MEWEVKLEPKVELLELEMELKAEGELKLEPELKREPKMEIVRWDRRWCWRWRQSRRWSGR